MKKLMSLFRDKLLVKINIQIKGEIHTSYKV